MKLKEYLEHLNLLVKENPEALEHAVVYGIDPEGNSFREVSWEPSVGHFRDRDFTSPDNMEDNYEYFYDEDDEDCPSLEDYKNDHPINSVCIN